MSDNSAIEWTSSTWNPTVGCAKVSPGCDNCYAIRTAARFQASPAYAGTVQRGPAGLDWTGVVNSLPDRLDAPLHWAKPRRIFVDSMSDLFHDDVTDEFIAKVFATMALTPRHTYQLLTKRHGRMESLLSAPSFPEQVTRALLTEPRFARGAWPVPDGGVPWPLPNVWGGVSVEDQGRAELRLHALFRTPFAVRWVSAEPLLGQVDLRNVRARNGALVDYLTGDVKSGDGREIYAAAPGSLDWLVVGGESGPGARPMHPAWARDLRDQCVAARVPFFFKQWGDWAPTGKIGVGLCLDATRAGYYHSPPRRDPNRCFAGAPYTIYRTAGGTEIEQSPEMRRVGKKAAGRVLDGRTWDEYPAVHSGQAVPA